MSGHGVTFLRGNDGSRLYGLFNMTQGGFSDRLLDDPLRDYAVQIHLKVDIYNRRPGVVPTDAAAPRRAHRRQENFRENFR